MKKILKLLVLVKLKIIQMIFNILDSFNEQFGKWYYLEFNLKTKSGDKEFFLPIIACMREELHTESLQRQIMKELLRYFTINSPKPIELTKTEKDLKVEQIEAQLGNYKTHKLETVIYKVVSKQNRPLESQLFTDEDLEVGNLDSDTKYSEEKRISFKIGIINNQGVPLHQIDEFFIVNLDKSKLE